MLAREQRGRHDDRDLLAGHRRDEGGAQRHLRLAEADIAADQPVHRLARAEVGDHRLDRAVLVLGLVVGKTIAQPGYWRARVRARRAGQRALPGGGGR